MISSTNISTTVVGNELGVSTRSVSQLCTSNNINKWSRYKPISYPVSNTDATPYWWRGTNGKCGFDIPLMNAGTETNTLTPIIEAYKKGTWNYIDGPKGGSNSPYRLGDFRGYDQNAQPFIRTGIKKGEIQTVNINVKNTLQVSVIANHVGGSLQLTDFAGMGEGLQDPHLFGALFDRNPLENPIASHNVRQVRVAEASIKQAGFIEFVFTQAMVGTACYIMLFMGSVTVSNSIPIPYDDNNYFMFQVDVRDDYPIEITPEKIGTLSDQEMHDFGYFVSNTFNTSNGKADVMIYFKIYNPGTQTFIISKTGRYIMRAQFYTFQQELIPSDANGNAMSYAVKPGQTTYMYAKGTKLFEGMMDTVLGDTYTTTIYIQIKDSNISNTNWQNVDSGHRIKLGK